MVPIGDCSSVETARVVLIGSCSGNGFWFIRWWVILRDRAAFWGSATRIRVGLGFDILRTRLIRCCYSYSSLVLNCFFRLGGKL